MQIKVPHVWEFPVLHVIHTHWVVINNPQELWNRRTDQQLTLVKMTVAGLVNLRLPLAVPDIFSAVYYTTHTLGWHSKLLWVLPVPLQSL